jgi:formylglycine-generating enzyme required for sulfatase activity
MADIFVSYSRADRGTVAGIVAALEAEGWSVWWDTRLRAGEQWDEVIEREINAARCVLVVWSPLSVTRYWVKVEANFGLSRGVLVPVAIEGAVPPLAYSLIQAADLSGWNGDAGAPAFRRTVEDIREKLRRAPGPPPEDHARALGAGTEAPAPAPAQNHAAERDWKHIEHSGDPRDFRAFIDEHGSGFLVRKARLRLQDLADDGFAAAGRDRTALERFLKLHFDSAQAEAARALLAELAAEETRLREAEERARRDEAARLAELRGKIASIGDRDTLLSLLPGAPEAAAARLQALGFLKAPSLKGGKPHTLWLKVGESFRDLDNGPEMVIVPAGEFWMGSKDGEGDDDERPRRRVKILKPFAVGRFAVTFDEWDAAVAAGGVQHKPSDQGWGRGRRPVINVNWDDAQSYIKWLSSKTGQPYRLLSEAEWEYCCRAGTETPYCFGNTIAKTQAQFSEGSYGSAGKTVEVCSFPANGFGLHDMHGNVWEWCQDCWNGNYHNAPADGSAWTTGECGRRVLRGGSWFNYPQNLRSAGRNRNIPDYRYFNCGFRLARTLI